MSPRSTGIPCETCGQMIKESSLRDYHADGGRERAICDCMKAGKTKYAVPIAKLICSSCMGERKYPSKIKTLLDQIKACLEGVRL